MRAVIFAEETIKSIILITVTWVISFIITAQVLIKLIQHFKRTPLRINKSLKVFSLLATIIDVLICLSAITINNSWLIPSIHENIKFIDDYCFLIALIQPNLFLLSGYFFQLFQLHKIKYVFLSTKFKLSSFSYYTQLVTYTIITLICSSILESFVPQILIVSDNKKHKICLMVTPDGIETTHFTYFIFCFISTLSVDIYLWYQLYSKTIKLELNYNENELLSP
eukprot:141740_1